MGTQLIITSDPPRELYPVTTPSTQGPFSIPWAFFHFNDIVVQVVDTATGVIDDTFTNQAGFAVQNAVVVDDGYQSGEVLLDAAVADKTVIVFRDTVIERLVQYGVLGPFSIQTTNNDFNRAFAIMQELEDEHSRFVQINPLDPGDGDPLTLPLAEDTYLLGWEGDHPNGVLVNYSPTEIVDAGGGGGGGGGATTLGGLTDVTLTGVLDQQVIVYDEGTDEWINATNSASAVTSVFGRVGAVDAESGDYDADLIEETATRTFVTNDQKAKIKWADNDVTGLVLGGEVTTATTTTVDISDGNGVHLDESDPAAPVFTEVFWSALTGIAITNIATQDFTVIGINSAGAVVQLSDITPADTRAYILLAQVNHPAGTIDDIVNFPQVTNTSGHNLIDFVRSLDPVRIISGGDVEPATDTVTYPLGLSTSAHVLWGLGVNWHSDKTDPNRVTVAAEDPITIDRVVDRNGDTIASAQTQAYVAQYDNLGTPTALAAGKYTTHLLFVTAGGKWIQQLGQEQYDSVVEAQRDLDNQTISFVRDPMLDDIAARTAWLIIGVDSADWNDGSIIDANADLTGVSPQGEFAEINLGNYSVGMVTESLHGISDPIRHWQVFARCLIDDAGYVIGDDVTVDHADDGHYTTAWVNTTKVGVSLQNKLRVAHKISGAATDMTAASWDIYFFLDTGLGAAGGSGGGISVADQNKLDHIAVGGTLGSAPTASGENDITFGDGADSAGGDAIAFGSDAQALFANGIAIGHDASIGVAANIAIGNAASAGGTDAMAIGDNAVADFTDAMAIGRDSSAAGGPIGQSVAIGAGAVASGAESVVIGRGAQANNGNSVAIGHSASVTGADGTALGTDATATTNGLAVGWGTNAARYTGGTMVGSGSQQASAGGGTDAIALGHDNLVSGASCFVIGNNQTINRPGSLVVANTGSIQIPLGTTAQRPGTPVAGDMRFDTTTGQFEGYDGAIWVDLGAGAGGGEANTASNQGAGVGVFDEKLGVDLEFRSLVVQGTGISIALDDPNDEIDFTLDADLQALGALATTGMSARTAADTWATRTITGTADQVSLADGDGVAGNPTISLADNVVFPGTEGVQLPSGTTAQRPGAPANGDIRYNSTLAKFEGYEAGAWANIIASASGEANTASNQGAGVGVFDEKTGVDLEFRSLVVQGTGLTIALDDPNDEIDFTLDADLQAVGALAGTGLAVRTAADTWTNRDVVGTTNEIALLNGDGVAGNPTVGLADNPVVPGTEGIQLPSGTTAQRPGAPANGDTRYNTTSNELETYKNGYWQGLGKVVQQVTSETTTRSTGTTVIPGDDTTPQITEGQAMLTQAITPKSTSNRLRVFWFATLSNSASGVVAAPLFQAGAANAVRTATGFLAANLMVCLSGYYDIAAPGTGSINFDVRWGSSTGTCRINRGNALYHNSLISSGIVITEYTP